MADSTNATPACNLVAIDVARYGNAVLVETTNGKRHRFKMVNSAADFSRLIDFLRGLPGACRAASSQPVTITVRLRIDCSVPGSRS